MSRTFQIRPAGLRDRATVIEFNLCLASETEAKQLDRETLARGVDTALADPERLRYWVAEHTDGRILGQAAVTREWSDWRNGWIWWLQSVYVAADSRGLGVFRALFETIRTEAAGRPDVIGLRLYVEKENDVARRVYEKVGFEPGGYDILESLWIHGEPPLSRRPPFD